MILQLLEMNWQSVIKSLAIAYHHLPDVGEHASVRDLKRRLYNLLSSEQIDVFVQFWMVLECLIWQSISCTVYRDWLLMLLRKHVSI